MEFVPSLRLTTEHLAGDGTEPFAAMFGNELETATELAQLALAPCTLENYRRAWRQFNEFCLAHGAPSMPAAPDLVALYLAGAAVATDADGVAKRNDYRELVRGRLSPGAVALHCSAIDRAHEVAGYRRPSTQPEVRAVIRGIRRTFGVRPSDPKRPLELDGLLALLRACTRGEIRRLRDRTTILLLHHGWKPPQIAAIRIERDIDMTDAGLRIAGAPNMNGSDLDLRASSDARLCPVATVQNLMAVLPSYGPLVPREVDAAALARLTEPPHHLTRQAVTQVIRRRATAAQVELPPSGAPTLTAGDLDRIIDTIDHPSLVDVRDRSLLLTGWSAALRQSNLRHLHWSDFTESMGELQVMLRRDKNDPYGEGRTLWLPRGSSQETCPVTAWQAWRTSLAAVIGGDPMKIAQDEPCFVAIDRHGRPRRTNSGQLARLSKDAVTDIIKDLCARAGLDPSAFASHSLRAGFITEASKRGETPTAIQEVSGHKTLEMVSRYSRPYDRRSFAPSRRMGL